MWYYGIEQTTVWRINQDGTRDGRSTDDPEIVEWIAEGNTPTEWTPEP
jgi:hypothetical protein